MDTPSDRIEPLFNPDDVRRLMVYLRRWLDAGQQLPIGAITAMETLERADRARGLESDAT